VASGADVVDAIEAALATSGTTPPPVRPLPDPVPRKPEMPVGSRW
jgi:hypothetical protein